MKWRPGATSTLMKRTSGTRKFGRASRKRSTTGHLRIPRSRSGGAAHSTTSSLGETLRMAWSWSGKNLMRRLTGVTVLLTPARPLVTTASFPSNLSVWKTPRVDSVGFRAVRTSLESAIPNLTSTVRGWELEKHMAGEELKAPYRVASAYESLMSEFQRAVEGAGKTLNRLSRPILNGFTQGVDVASAQFAECFYLKNWPCRKLSSQKRLDVVVKVMETLARSDWSLTKSTVYVNYFVVTGGEAELVQSLHYDFVRDGQADHPYFHVQLSDETIPEEDLRS